MSNTAATAATVWVAWMEGGNPTLHRTREGAEREAERLASHIETQTGWKPHVWVTIWGVQD